MRTWLTQRVLLPAVQAALKNGAWDCFNELNATQWCSLRDVRARQQERLSQLLHHAYATVPLYRRAFDEAGLTPDDVERPEQLTALPIQTKGTLRAHHPQDTVSQTAPAADRIANSTSGSTGSPFEFTMSRRLMGMRWGRYLRGQTWTGMALGERYVRLWGPHGRPRLERAAIKLTLNMTELSAFGMDGQRMRSYVNLIRRSRPRIIEAYASAAAGLAVFMNQTGIRDVHVDAVVTSGETLFDAHRDAIEEAFHCPVFNRYGCREFGGIAHECAEHRGLHLNAESFIIEFVEDERSAETGLCRIVLTNLDNFTMPFIRYDIGDVGRPGEADCRCGRGLPLIEAPFGRMIDLVFSPSGRMISVHFLTLLFGDYSRYVSGFQAIQTKPDRLDVAFVPTASLTPMIEKELHARLQEHTGEDMQVVLAPVSELPVGQHGKRALLRSDVKASPSHGGSTSFPSGRSHEPARDEIARPRAGVQ